MSKIIRTIQLKRTNKSKSEWTLDTKLVEGEPLAITNDDDEYLAIGKVGESKAITNLPLFKAYTQDVVDTSTFYDVDKQVTDFNNTTMQAAMRKEDKTLLAPFTTAKSVWIQSSDGTTSSNVEQEIGVPTIDTEGKISYTKNSIRYNINYLMKERTYADSYNVGGAAKRVNVYGASESNPCYLVGIYGSSEVKGADAADLQGKDLYAATQNTSATYKTGIYFNAATGVMYGAAWNNDYAEYRLTKCEAGECVIEAGDGTLVKSNKKCVPGASIVSDTFGYVIGVEKNSKPIAVSGRVLAYVDCKDKLKVGDTVCSSTGGNVTKMSKLQKILHPECIIGTVSEIPTYKKWGKTDINERVWIKLK